MLENEIIGVTGVFVLTLFLILLYHLMSKIGHGRRHHGAPIKAASSDRGDTIKLKPRTILPRIRDGFLK